ncbi:MAG: hypothetical protein PUB18_00955 [bacterium]|nr:hypothetical protein [bacterium]
MEISTDNIVTIVTTIVQIIIVLFYAITMLKSNKKSGLKILDNIVKTIPTYIGNARQVLTNPTNTKILNYVIAEIKGDFEEALTKKQEKQITKKVEEVLANEKEN